MHAVNDEVIERQYARWVTRLGVAMTKTRQQAAMQLYKRAVNLFLLIASENKPGLSADVEADPFVGPAMSSATYELYHC